MVGKIVKVGFWLAALIGVCYAAQRPGVADSLLLFFTLGKVPGTDIMLSPEATFWVVGILFVLLVGLVFGGSIYRGLHLLFDRYPANPELAGQPLASETVEVAPDLNADEQFASTASAPPVTAAVALPKAPGLAATLFARTVGRTKRLLSPELVKQLQATKVQLQVLWRLTKLLLHRVSSQLTRGIWFVLARIGGLAELLVSWGARWITQAWRWLEPRIRSFDARMAERVHSHETIQALLHIAREISRMITRWQDGVRSLFSPPKA